MKIIPLTKGKQAVVCDCHYALVSQHKWYFAGGYAGRYVGGRTVFMHRLIQGPHSSPITDHKDGNVLNNQCSNLRPATILQNKQNSALYKNNQAGYKGVSYDRCRWRAQICVNGKRLSVGRFTSKEAAARAYNEAAIKYFGKYARLNEVVW